MLHKASECPECGKKGYRQAKGSRGIGKIFFHCRYCLVQVVKDSKTYEVLRVVKKSVAVQS